MKKSIISKAFILGMSLSILTSVAHAEEGGGQSPAYQGQTVEIDSRLLQKQAEIDKYVFEDHAKEIEAKGFKITYTGPMGEYVEIGITPYSEENAKFLYDIFGNDMVKVVEGQQAVLMDVGPAKDVEPVPEDNPDARNAATSDMAPDIVLSTSVSSDDVVPDVATDTVAITSAPADDVAATAELYTASGVSTQSKDASSMALPAIAAAAGAIIVIGGSAVVIRKRKTAER